jgi:hypothetical protein
VKSYLPGFSVKTECLPVAKVFIRSDLSFGAVLQGDCCCSIVNCRCLHQFRIVFGGAHCVALYPLLLLCSRLAHSSFPSLPPPFGPQCQILLPHPLNAANMRHVSLSAVGMYCAVLKVVGPQPLLFPPFSHLCCMANNIPIYHLL